MLFPDARIERRHSQPGCTYADVLVSEVGTEVRPTQPPHSLRINDVPSGYWEDLKTFGTPDTVDITSILSVDMTPLTSISTSGMDVTSCPYMSVAKSVYRP